MEQLIPQVVISSLSSFFEIIETENLNDYIFRGENEFFEKRNASAFRAGYGKKHNILRIQREYKNRVISNLSPLELAHFQAFCQHHGIPTDLLDFTTSPLVALYFACQNVDDEGYVHLIKKQRLIDVTDIMINNEYGVMSLLLNDFDGEDYRRFREKVEEYFKENENEIKPILLELIENYKLWDYKLKVQNPAAETKPTIIDLREYLQKSDYKSYLNEFISEIHGVVFEETYKEARRAETWYNATTLYLLLLRQHFTNIFHRNDRQELCSIYGEFELNCSIIFTYSPPSIFKRIELQQGLLVNQMHLSLARNNRAMCKQIIKSDYVIKVVNKREILKQLDLVGINEAFIFNDNDSIARYVTEKFK